MKKLNRPVKATWYWFHTAQNTDIISASATDKDGECYIVPSALWRRAQKALKASKKAKKGRGK